MVVRHGARVVSDEIHAPLVLPGGRHTPYASIEGTAEHVTTLLSASKAFNVPGLKCAQIVAGTPADAQALAALPRVANHGLSPLGLEANVAAYEDTSPWLDTDAGAPGRQLPAVRRGRSPSRCRQPGSVRWRRPTWPGSTCGPTATSDPRPWPCERGRVMVREGSDFGPGGEGHVRVNLATSRARVLELARRLGTAFDPAD